MSRAGVTILIHLILSLLITSLVGVPSVLAAFPTNPIKQVDVTMPVFNGSTFTAASCADIQTQLNAAALATPTLNHRVIIPVALGTCTGTFFLPSHIVTPTATSGWIFVQTDQLASLPASGTRVTMAQASLMPTIMYGSKVNPVGGCGDQSAMSAATGANGYRLIGMHMVQNHAIVPNFALFYTGNGVCTSMNTGYIVLDRSILENTDKGIACDTGTDRLMRTMVGEAQNGNIAVVDSILTGAKGNTTSDSDTQAFLAISNPGPILVQNTELMAAGEVLMIGGGQPISSAWEPFDITIKTSWFHKDRAFQSASNSCQLKTLLELKLGTRVLITGNQFTDTWAGTAADSGHAFRFTVRSWGANSTCWPNPPIPCPQTFAAAQDVEFSYNLVAHIGGGFTYFDSDDGGGGNSQPSSRYWIHDNFWYDIGGAQGDPTCAGACGQEFGWEGGGPYASSSIYLTHNTWWMDYGSAPVIGGKNWFDFVPLVPGQKDVSGTITKTPDSDFIIRDNFMQMGTNGIFGNACNGTCALDGDFGTTPAPTGYLITNNAFAGIGAVLGGGSIYLAGSRFVSNCWGANGSHDSTNNLTLAGYQLTSPSDASTNPSVDFAVKPGSPFKAGGACQASDGTDMGVNIAAWQAAQGGGGPPPPVPPAAPTGVTVN